MQVAPAETSVQALFFPNAVIVPFPVDTSRQYAVPNSKTPVNLFISLIPFSERYSIVGYSGTYPTSSTRLCPAALKTIRPVFVFLTLYFLCHHKCIDDVRIFAVANVFRRGVIPLIASNFIFLSAFICVANSGRYSLLRCLYYGIRQRLYHSLHHACHFRFLRRDHADIFMTCDCITVWLPESSGRCQVGSPDRYRQQHANW